MDWVTVFCLGLTGISVGLSCVAWWRWVPLEWRFAPPVPVAAQGDPRFETVLDYRLVEGVAHAPAIVVTPEGFRVIWYEGAGEARPDVSLHSARFERAGKGWSGGPEGVFVTAAELASAMEPAQSVVRLGNVVENEAVAGGLFATVASVGGWAMASVVDLRGAWARKLNLSPVLGRSHLVKSPMVGYMDGSGGLPAYFEMGQAHGVLARFDATGRVVDARRMLGEGQPIQPIIVPLDERRAVAFLRDLGGGQRLLISRTEDGGQNWTRVERMDAFHANAPVAALGLGQGRILLALNDSAVAPDDLNLVLSEDEGESWRVLQVFQGGRALRYPMLRRLPGGEIVLCYSCGTKRGVVAHVFNQAWVEAA